MPERYEFCLGLFNDSYPPIMDGVANTVYNYARYLNRSNVRPVVVTPGMPRYNYQDEFEILPYFSIPLPKRKPYRLGIAKLDFKLMKTLSNMPFNIVHAHSPFSAGRLALKIGRERGIPVVATLHAKFYDDFLQAVKSKTAADLMLARVMNFFDQCDFVWTVNRSTIETLRSYGYQKAVEIVENGTDFIPVDNPAECRELVNINFNLNDSENVLLFVGQHIWHKNVKLIINALSLLKKDDFPYRMIFAGKGDAEADMKKMVNRLGLNDHVIFAGQILDREFLRALYIRADLFIFPSEYDTSGIVVQEAAASGTPSILMRGSNAAENIKDGINGFLTDNSAEFLASVIKKALSDHDNLIKAGKNAFNSIYKPWEKIVIEVKERYKDIIKNWKGKK